MKCLRWNIARWPSYPPGGIKVWPMASAGWHQRAESEQWTQGGSAFFYPAHQCHTSDVYLPNSVQPHRKSCSDRHCIQLLGCSVCKRPHRLEYDREWEQDTPSFLIIWETEEDTLCSSLWTQRVSIKLPLREWTSWLHKMRYCSTMLITNLQSISLRTPDKLLIRLSY